MPMTTRRDIIRSTVAGVTLLPVLATAQANPQSPPTPPQEGTPNQRAEKPSTQKPSTEKPSSEKPSTEKPSTEKPKPQPKPDEAQSPTPGARVIKDRMRTEREVQMRALRPALQEKSDLSGFNLEADELGKTLDGNERLTRRLPTTRIGDNLAFRPADRDFFAIRCDGLAAESSSLLARCLDLRKEWEAVYSTAHAFMFDVDRFNRLDAIFKMQEANGYFDLEPTASAADLESISAMLGPLSSASGTMKSRLDEVNAQFDEQYGWIQMLGWLSHISGYGNSGDATATVTWNEESDTVINHCRKAAVAQGRMQLANLLGQLSSDLETRTAQLNSLKARLPNLQSRADWDQKNKRLRKLQVEAMRGLYQEKHRLVDASSGPLNFTERLNELRETFSSVLSDGLARLPAIARGFETVFGYSEPVPKIVGDFIQHPEQPQPAGQVLDAAQKWLNDLGRWHAQFSQGEQIHTVIASVKQALKREEWISFLRNGTTAVPIGEAAFPDQRHIRCRAISLYTAGLEGFCSASIRVPVSSFYVHADSNRHNIDQSTIPVLRHSRVTAIDAARPSDRIGINQLYNCSPLGTWMVSVADKTSTGADRDRLEDLFLEIIVAQQ